MIIYVYHICVQTYDHIHVPTYEFAGVKPIPAINIIIYLYPYMCTHMWEHNNHIPVLIYLYTHMGPYDDHIPVLIYVYTYMRT